MLTSASGSVPRGAAPLCRPAGGRVSERTRQPVRASRPDGEGARDRGPLSGAALPSRAREERRPLGAGQPGRAPSCRLSLRLLLLLRDWRGGRSSPSTQPPLSVLPRARRGASGPDRRELLSESRILTRTLIAVLQIRPLCMRSWNFSWRSTGCAGDSVVFRCLYI